MHAPFDCSRLIYAMIFVRYPKRLRSIQSFSFLSFPFSLCFFTFHLISCRDFFPIFHFLSSSRNACTNSHGSYTLHFLLFLTSIVSVLLPSSNRKA